MGCVVSCTCNIVDLSCCYIPRLLASLCLKINLSVLGVYIPTLLGEHCVHLKVGWSESLGHNIYIGLIFKMSLNFVALPVLVFCSNVSEVLLKVLLNSILC